MELRQCCSTISMSCKITLSAPTETQTPTLINTIPVTEMEGCVVCLSIRCLQIHKTNVCVSACFQCTSSCVFVQDMSVYNYVCFKSCCMFSPSLTCFSFRAISHKSVTAAQELTHNGFHYIVSVKCQKKNQPTVAKHEYMFITIRKGQRQFDVRKDRTRYHHLTGKWKKANKIFH